MRSNQPLAALLAVVLLCAGAAHAQEQPRQQPPREFDFADAAQLEAFAESSGKSSVRYPQRPDVGVGGAPGFLAVLNDGSRDDGLYYVRETFNLRRESVVASLFFRADGTNGKGAARIFLGLAGGTAANLAKGDAKIGVRLFKSASAGGATPWVLQLVNGVATRDLGAPLALSDKHWYRLTFTVGLGEDGRRIAFTADLQEFDAAGTQSLQLRRTGEGATDDLGSYDLTKLNVAFLGQNQQGGATAIDNLEIRTAARPGGPVPEALRPVVVPPPPAPAESVQAPPRTLFGAAGHFMHTPLFYRDGDKGVYWQLEYTLPLLLKANLGWVREPLYQPWFDDPGSSNAMENRKTVERYLEQYQRHGVRVILVPLAVGPDNKRHAVHRDAYFTWLADLCARFSCVNVVEMHNEPNLSFFWKGTAADYVQTYRDAARIIRQRAPKVTIAVGSISSLWWEPGIQWLTQVLDAGALEWADAVAVHPYNKRLPPETDPHFDRVPADDPHHLEKAIHAFAELVQSKAPAGRTVGLYFTELGYSSGVEGMAALGDEQRQGDYLSRLMLIYLAVRLDGVPLRAVTWYDLKDDGQNDHAESNFGLIGYDTSRLKPAYDVYRRIAGFFDDPDRFARAAIDVTSTNWPDALQYHVWRRLEDGAIIVPVWRLERRQATDVDFLTELRIPLPDGAGPPTRILWHSLYEQTPRSIGWSSGDGTLRVPVYLTRRAGWLEILFAADENKPVAP